MAAQHAPRAGWYRVAPSHALKDAMTTAINLAGLTKRFPAAGGGTVTAVDRVTLAVEDGELFFLLGPSGCGKTTLLRAIAGFVTPDQGEIVFDTRSMVSVSPKDRGTGMVFQNYALWPHMTVNQNVSFGLDVRNIPAEE